MFVLKCRKLISKETGLLYSSLEKFYQIRKFINDLNPGFQKSFVVLIQ